VRRVVAVISALVALAVAGCGSTSSGSSDVSAAAYVKTVCSAVRGWATDIDTRSGALNVAAIKNADQGKAAIKKFFTAAVADTGDVVAKLQAAGTPSIKDGKTVAGAFVSAFSQIQTALTRGQSQAAALPTASSTAFQDAGKKLAASIQSSLNQIGTGLGGLRSPELEAAAKKQPACAPLTSG
jgi:hypothetical protein